MRSDTRRRTGAEAIGGVCLIGVGVLSTGGTVLAEGSPRSSAQIRAPWQGYLQGGAEARIAAASASMT
jgi:hypothetical protein